MDKKHLIAVLVISILLIASSLMASEQLDEVNAKFTYKGKPIHPFLVGEFSNPLSDNHPPMVTTVDVSASFDTNKYPADEVKWQYGQWRVEHKKGDGLDNYEAFGYSYLGKMANNIHVVELGNSGGGSGYFMDLVFIKFSEGEIFYEGKKEKQLLMSVVGIYTLGDRYEGKIKVYPDKVSIPASNLQHGGGSVDKDIELKLL